ncbi:hypothetical protein P170DRAFT_440047 [Aspergillus steynii IBT 23096]|uniref:Zn(2)-C6 fungal-type domain-containing protein n=1 Tax=Aspergillus steynii IBT 23096 TaxID=1392250 RepID=A0A2I2FW05_9EURO|nr:uncharacterized protein P170DRAFT_440047 [Aspergillus steynii IBT 23096]PLB44820.1 hypothetical protein P170DRAFT_440047 [Aspergillus steynii IBT 23096]
MANLTVSIDALAPERQKVSRSSLACLSCRSRHVKCDNKRPECGRCTRAGKQCYYTESRRGGLDRAALTEKRRRLAAASSTDNGDSSSTDNSKVSTVPQPAGNLASLNGVGVADATTPSGLAASVIPNTGIHNIHDDTLIDAYYENFHKFHPVALPRSHLARFYQDHRKPLNLEPLIAVMRCIGHLYRFKQWSDPLRSLVETSFSEASPKDPIMVQCRLLYSSALFWYEYKTESKQEMDHAVAIAVEIGMFRREFATEHGHGDPVLIESWRRTWWSLYVVDGYYAGTLGTMDFTVINIDATVDLPCQESEYESGKIPQPRTLEEFDSREFDFSETPFSSFAYLIGAVRCAAAAISAVPRCGKTASLDIIQAADAIVDGWLLLLPQEHKQVLTKTGEIDELIFQAHLVIHVSIIGMHRPLSDLRFSPVEHVSSCARDHLPETVTPELVNVHTARVLRSVEAQIRLLALPIRPFHHTPFLTCMISEGTLALLSACNFLLKGKDLAIARDQLRMIIGCLKALAELWPRTQRNVHEIQLIARYVLGLEQKRADPVESVSGGVSGSEESAQGVELEVAVTSDDALPSVDALEGIDLWQSLGDLDAGLSWWGDAE